MNLTSHSPLWNWKGWQPIKWITGIIILVVVLCLIYTENIRGNGWLEKEIKERVNALN